MQHRILIIVCLFFGLTTASAFGEESDWKATLRGELQRCSARLELHQLNWHLGLGGRTYFKVTTPAAKILEERRREELLPFLSELRKSADKTGEHTLDNWTEVVSKGLHSGPSEFRIGQEEIAVRGYADPD